MATGVDRSVLTIRPTASVVVSNPYVDQVLANASAGALTVTLISRTGRMEHKVAVQKTDDSANEVTIIAGLITATLSTQNDALVFEQDDLGAFHVFTSSGASVSSLTIPAGSSLLAAPAAFDGESSYQPVAPDLNLDADAGVDAPDSAYLAAVMGNVLGDALTKDANVIAGVIGKFSVTGARASEYPLAGIVGEISDGVTTADAGVVSVVGGDSTQTNARAFFAIDNQNSVPGSGNDWVLDGHGEAHSGYPAAVPLKGFARVNQNSVDLPVGIFFGVATDDAGIVAQVGADATIGDGSLYISHLDGAGKLFQKQNDVWVDLQA